MHETCRSNMSAAKSKHTRTQQSINKYIWCVYSWRWSERDEERGIEETERKEASVVFERRKSMKLAGQVTKYFKLKVIFRL